MLSMGRRINSHFNPLRPTFNHHCPLWSILFLQPCTGNFPRSAPLSGESSSPLLDVIEFNGEAAHTLASPDGAADPPFARRVASPFLQPLFLLPSPAPTKTSCAASFLPCSSVSPPRPFARSRRKKTVRFASASSSMPMARAPFTKPMRPITKPSPLPPAKMASRAEKFDWIWMRTDDFFVEEFLGQRNNFDLSCKINTTPIIV